MSFDAPDAPLCVPTSNHTFCVTLGPACTLLIGLSG
jgi:hypothetical protein